MMISPYTYSEEYIRGKTKEEILTQIRGLKMQMGKLKREIEIRNEGDILCCPMPETQLVCTREYLEEAKRAFRELGGEWENSIREERAEKFDREIYALSELYFRERNTYGKSEEVRVNIGEKDLVWERRTNGHSMEQENGYTDGMDAEEFLSELRRLHIGEWKRKYAPEQYGILGENGTSFDLVLNYSGEKKPSRFHGVGVFPFSYRELKTLLGL